MFPQHYYLIYCIISASIILHHHQASATVVSFANTPSSPSSQHPSSTVFQVFYSGRDPDVCCEALDINIHDGQGYGWFRADLVAFSHIEAANIFTSVFGRRTRRQCSADLIATKHGIPDWQIEVPEASGGAGSAGIVKGLNPGKLKLKYPNLMVVGDVRYNFYFEDASTGVLTYMDRDQNTVMARPFVNPIISHFESNNRTTRGGGSSRLMNDEGGPV
ncbi:MAG: hypothetical protein Q9212_004209 [Teloschistes hypoglaucus]